MSLPKALYWGNTPFLLPRTEKNENGYDNEGLQSGYVYLTPVNGKKAKSGKSAYEQNVFTFSIVQGYIAYNHIFFQPEKAGDFHGKAFAFNRPKDESKEDKIKAQERLLTEWASNYCVAILDCREHAQLKKLTDDFDGYWLKSGDIMIRTEATDHDKLPQNEKDTYDWFVEQVKQQGQDVDELLQEHEDTVITLIERGLFLPIALSDTTRLYTVSSYRNIFSEDVLANAKPSDKPDLAKIAEDFKPPEQNTKSSNGNYGGKYGGKQVTPQDRLDFVTKQLQASGFPVQNLGDIAKQANANTSAYNTLQLALSLSGVNVMPDLLNISWYDKLHDFCQSHALDYPECGELLQGKLSPDETQSRLLMQLLDKHNNDFAQLQNLAQSYESSVFALTVEQITTLLHQN